MTDTDALMSDVDSTAGVAPQQAEATDAETAHMQTTEAAAASEANSVPPAAAAEAASPAAPVTPVQEQEQKHVPAAAAAAAPHDAAQSHLSDEERAIYDRQLRVWGVEAQKRMRSSSVLLVGMSGLSAELAKNLVLAGVGSLTLLDGACVSPSDLSANFLLRAEDVGRNRAEACLPNLRLLNPNVAVAARATSAEAMLASPDAAAFFTSFRAVCVVGQAISVQARISALIRGQATAGTEGGEHKSTDTQTHEATAAPADDSTSDEAATAGAAAATAAAAAAAAVAPPSPVHPAFFSCEVFGLSGFFFCDLQRHSYTEARRLRDSVTGVESEEEVVVEGVSTYERTVAQLLEYQGASSGADTFAEMSKRFGRRAQEKSACQLWLAMRTAMQWRERHAQGDSALAVAADANGGAPAPASPLPSLLSGGVGESSLLSLRDEVCARLGVADAERTLPSSRLLSLARTLGVELSPVCAMVGGILGQEILKVISGKDKPLSNTFVCEATEGYGIIKEL